ncbi:ATP-grasp domain-containing protein [Planococcus sp. N064]|uniref:ATP-grasp domain-containing protein n=1 Tax=Planococcus liqunii TaxID=3058394 RepID=A0ABT8MSY3_9BACL|nr:ATP-grasp domain-containing protein [Planococcus sp. N064]MDN7228021.1 ATP-grasp domain-containing protein [Planococcus sp. N064]
MKKILILGGYTHMIDVVKTAKRLGMYTIVADRDVGSPAKAYADQSYNVSTSDIDMLAEIAEAEAIDGVFNGFDDINTWHALALSKRLSLPFYATEEQLEICSNKDRFKEYCRDYGIPVIEEYNMDESLKEEDLAKLTFPVIVKPVDSYASQGITVCYSAEELKEGYKKAADYSKSEKVIVERFIDNPYGVMMFYTVRNGSVVLSAMTDRYVHKQYQEHPPLPTATIFPSQHLDLYLEVLDQKVRTMLREMKIENGVLFIQSLFEDGEFYFYEMGFRLSGTQYYTIVEKQTGINLLEMMLDYSTGGNLDQYAIEKYDKGYTAFPACNLSILLDKGTIKEIIGLEKVKAMPTVLSYIPVHGEGDEVEITGTYAQMLGRFNIAADSPEQFDKTIREINDSLHVLSSKGEEMILAKYVPADAELSIE